MRARGRGPGGRGPRRQDGGRGIPRAEEGGAHDEDLGARRGGGVQGRLVDPSVQGEEEAEAPLLALSPLAAPLARRLLPKLAPARPAPAALPASAGVSPLLLRLATTAPPPVPATPSRRAVAPLADPAPFATPSPLPLATCA